MDVKKIRTMKYFIDAAIEVVEDVGMENATIRKIAEKSGYNIATVYNYFEDFDHLIFYTKISYLENYTERLSKEIGENLLPLHEFLKIWEIFANEAFKNPKVFYDLFFSKYCKVLDDTLNTYYEIYPEKVKTSRERLVSMLNEPDIYMRNMTLINNCLENNCFSLNRNIGEINEIIVLTFRGFLDEYIELGYSDVDGYTEKFMKYLRTILNIE
jgi:AcrR family transcriptional regulator